MVGVSLAWVLMSINGDYPHYRRLNPNIHRLTTHSRERKLSKYGTFGMSIEVPDALLLNYSRLKNT